MVNQAVEPAAKASYLDMSDADMVNAAVPDDLVVAEVSEEVTTAPEVVAEAPEVAETETTSPEVVGSAATDEDAGTVAEEGGEEPAVKIDKDLVTTSKSPEPVTDKPVEKEAGPSINFEAEYNRLLTPFKANGREITVNSVDDAISLMQMGANYNKKMAGLKPNLKLMKLLENNGLLSEEKIGWLIDLDRKSPDAINKLVKDSGLSPMDLDVEKASEYRPKIHTVDEREIELDTVLDDLQGSPAYSRTLNIVSKEWDGASKQVIAGQPQLLRVINSHIETGIYDQISTEVEQQRVFGRLNGLSDIEAYRQVGDAIQARGGFNHVGKSQGQTTAAPVVVQPKPKKVEDDKLNDKRRAASSTKPVVPTTVDKDFNPLSLSDADFNKLSADRFR